ncbi:terminal uridylyltransferase 7 [Trichonephila clavata]|uniref:Terminal uridylyltransferase 7 n=1 Tax=Trichonephila clavata TaxID=2740835 RepID=A0A8X6H6M7_TRICU|nr:terminal uridylyltransferase 7 [Trichonephila clavata]
MAELLPEKGSSDRKGPSKKSKEIGIYRPKIGAFAQRCKSERSNQPFSCEQDSNLGNKYKNQLNSVADSEKCKSHKKISSYRNSFTSNKTSSNGDNRFGNDPKIVFEEDFIKCKQEDFSEVINHSLPITTKNNDSDLEKRSNEVEDPKIKLSFDEHHVKISTDRTFNLKRKFLGDGKLDLNITFKNDNNYISEIVNIPLDTEHETVNDNSDETFCLASKLNCVNDEIKQNSSLYSVSNELKNNLPEISTIQSNLESSISLDDSTDYCASLYKCKITDLAASVSYNNHQSFIPPPQPKPVTNTVIYPPEVTGEIQLNSSAFPCLSTENSAGRSSDFVNRSVSSSNESDCKDTVDIKTAAHDLDDKQIDEITKFLENIVHEKSMASDIADRVVKDVNKVLSYRMKGNMVYAYGSYRIDTAVTTSNLNLALKTDQPVKNNFLLLLQKVLSKNLTNYQVYPFEEEQNARRSKICFSQNELGVYCEIIYLGDTVSQYLKLSNILRSVCKYDERVKILCSATRRWAEDCEIQDPEKGMLHPIGFTLLVIHFLQQMEKPVLPLINLSSENWGLHNLPLKNKASVGELWLKFLKYYSCTFNWTENVISVTDEKIVPKSKKFWDVSWIAIEDPMSKKNIADSIITSDRAEIIISSFKSTYEYFLSPLSDSDSSSESGETGSQNSEKYSFLECALPPVFDSDCDDDSEYENCQEHQRIVLEPLKKISELSMSCVNHVLIEAYKEFKIPDYKVNERKAFVRELEKELKRLYPDVELTLFGSSVNGFGFKNSDLDICMTFKAKDKTDIYAPAVLRRVLKQLRKNKSYKNVVPLYSAQVPIIKFHYIAKNWNCDLSFYNVLAVHNSILLHKYSLMDERCKILGYCLKLLAKKANIADGASRTLSSYSYILMVIHYLQQVNPPVLPVMPVFDKEAFEKRIVVPQALKSRNYWCLETVTELKKRYRLSEKNTSSVGELWLGLLEYYVKFDFDKAVTITENEPVLTSTLMKSARFINIEDPFLSKKNLGCIVSENKAETSRRVLQRARMLFGKDCPYENKENLQSYYFSPSNLTNQYVKDVECLSCGCFGHEKIDCTKANPFKKKQFMNRTQTNYKASWDE